MHIQAIIDEEVFDLDLNENTVHIGGEMRPLTTRWLTERTVYLLIGHRSIVLTVEKDGDNLVTVTHRGHRQQVRLKTERDLLLERLGMDTENDTAASELRAPMPGLVLQVNAAPGDEVEPGQGLIVLEAMKMENELSAPSSAVVETVHVEPGAAVGKNELLISFAG